jgi:hypothetical protein
VSFGSRDLDWSAFCCAEPAYSFSSKDEGSGRLESGRSGVGLLESDMVDQALVSI